jgi:serine/threonine protein phosphatase 1
MRTVDRILAISDPHAENKKLLHLLKKVEYDPDRDLLIIVGDMIDRGEENLDMMETCEKLRKNGAILLKGNHEQFAQAAITEMLKNEIWRSHPGASLYNWYTYNGGASMYYEIRDLSAKRLEKLLTFVQTLPLYFTVGKFIFSHAGANIRKPIEKNSEDELVWMEEQFPSCRAYREKVMVFGHVPTWQLYPYNKKLNKKNAKIWYDKMYEDKIGIDCGSCFGGRLAALELPGYREFYV